MNPTFKKRQKKNSNHINLQNSTKMKLFDEIAPSKLDLLSTSTFSSVGISSAKAAPKRAIAVNKITLMLKNTALYKPSPKTKLYKMPK